MVPLRIAKRHGPARRSGQEAGKDLAEDPQVKGAFQIAELLGLGAIPAEVKQRSLRIGAATEKALGMARSAFNQDLDALALPVLEPARKRRPRARCACSRRRSFDPSRSADCGKRSNPGIAAACSRA